MEEMKWKFKILTVKLNEIGQLNSAESLKIRNENKNGNQFQFRATIAITQEVARLKSL